jgi:hypothetical protein
MLFSTCAGTTKKKIPAPINNRIRTTRRNFFISFELEYREQEEEGEIGRRGEGELQPRA